MQEHDDGPAPLALLCKVRLEQGKLAKVHTVSFGELKDGKFLSVRNYCVRLSMAKQVAKGLVAKRAVNAIVNELEKPLRKQREFTNAAHGGCRASSP